MPLDPDMQAANERIRSEKAARAAEAARLAGIAADPQGHLDRAIEDGLVLHSERAGFLMLAARNIATFDAVLSGRKEVIGYSTREGEIAALVDAADPKLTFTARLNKISRDYPDVAAQASFERSGVTRADAVRTAGSAALASEVATNVAAGMPWHEAIGLAAKRRPELVAMRANGEGPAK